MLQAAFLLVIGVATLASVLQLKVVRQFMGRARFVPANIVIDTQEVIFPVYIL